MPKPNDAPQFLIFSGFDITWGQRLGWGTQQTEWTFKNLRILEYETPRFQESVGWTWKSWQEITNKLHVFSYLRHDSILVCELLH